MAELKSHATYLEGWKQNRTMKQKAAPSYRKRFGKADREWDRYGRIAAPKASPPRFKRGK